MDVTIQNREKIVVIFSGGLDSTTVIYYLKNLGYEIFPLCFDYGQKHKIELKKAKITCNKLGLIYKEVNMQFMKDLLGDSSALTSDKIEIPTLEEIIGEPQPITYIPFRNMLMSSIALSYAEAIGATKIVLGIQKVDEYTYWDCDPKFQDAINNISKLNRENQIKLITPFVNMSKTDEIILGNSIGVPYEDTWTSYKIIDEENEIADSTNSTSRDRIISFAKAGIKDPQKYEIELNWEELFKKYYREGEYTLEKIKEKINDL